MTNHIRENELDKNYLQEETDMIKSILSEFHPENPHSEEGIEFNSEIASNAVEKIEKILSTVSDKYSPNKDISSLHYFYYNIYKSNIDNHSLIFEIGKESKILLNLLIIPIKKDKYT